MRDISPFTSLLASGERIEPIIAVAFNDELIFTDKDRILQIGNLTIAQRSDSMGSAGEVTVVLDDHDGALKALFDSRDLQKQPVTIYQKFNDLDDKVVLFAGQVATPIIWDEGARTLTFDVTSRLEDLEVGFSPEMVAYPFVPQELLGTPWPMAFGHVHHLPGLQLTNVPAAFTTSDFGIVDRTISTEIANLQTLLEYAILATQYYSLQAQDPSDPLGFGNSIQNDGTVKQYVKMQKDIQDRITELKLTTGWQQGAVGSGSVGLIPTVFVTQPYTGLLRVGNNLFRGTISQDGGSFTTVPQTLPGSPAGTPGIREGFQYYPAGTQVVIAGNYKIKYVVSTVPGTVTKVWAMRSFNGLSQMAEVPRDWYTIETHSIGSGMTATYVVLNQPLSTRSILDSIKTQNWENSFGKHLPGHVVNQVDWDEQIYVSFQSSVGPNPVDIMEWVITNFSQNGFDSASFDAVRPLVANCPMNFAIQDNPSVTSLLAEIAYQAKCLIYLKDDVFHLIYLPATPTPVDTITEADIMVGTLQVGCTPTDDLVTKYTATFKPDYSPFFDTPVRMVVRYNIPKYGLHSEDHDFFCYNQWAPVQSAAQFWVIRKSQTYKILKCRFLLTKLNLEVFDYVTLDFDHPYVSSAPVVGLITALSYDTAGKWIDAEIWCPVLLGEMAATPYAYPVGASVKVTWPKNPKMAGGGGGSYSAPEIPQLNSRSEGVGQYSVGGQPTWPSSFVRPVDWGWEDPAGVGPTPAPMPLSKLFPRTPVRGVDPTEDYEYKDYPSITLKNGTFPGVVQKKLDNEDQPTYQVSVYTTGLDKDPSTMKVVQLQIDKDDVIPEGTWVEVSVVNGVDDDGNPTSMKTMQVPIWLQ